MQCPKCSSTNYRTNGKTKKGTVRYFCKDCHKSWSDRPIGRPPKGLVAMTNAERQRLFRQRKKGVTPNSELLTPSQGYRIKKL